MYPSSGGSNGVPSAEAVLHELPVPVFVTDVGGRVIYLNRLAESVFGISSEAARGEAIMTVTIPEERSTLERIGEALRTGGVWQGDVVVPKPHGETSPMHFTVVTRASDEGVQWNVSVGFDVGTRRDREAVLARLASRDELTGLQNRVGLEEWLEATQTEGERLHLVVCFIDLDHFKLVNDVLGHQAGDELLIQVAERLRSEMGSLDAVARLGGDEFVVASRARSLAAAQELGERVRGLFAEPFEVGGQELFTTASVGVALASDEPASVSIQNADAAMYIAKRRGRNRCELFDAGLQRHRARRLRLARDLHHAVARDELELLYQPIVRLTDDSMVGVEALLRWCHPSEGPLLPSEFVRIAEETGTIGEIGAWVLDHACEQLANWQRTGAADASFALAINLSARQLAEPGLVSTLRYALARHRLDGDQLWLEITETAYRGEMIRAHDALTEARRLGVRVAIDDFGTGFSSLARLRELPIDVLKVDRSFVAGLPDDDRDASLVDAILAIGRGLGFVVVAEGVETTPQLRALAAHGCQYAQGHLLGRPMAADQIQACLKGALAHSS